jgi:hypothetical protein
MNIYRISKSRKQSSQCTNRYCNKFISRSEWAYTSSPKPLCASCGHLENQYQNEGMERPAI